MKKYLKTDEWNIIEDQFHPDRQRMSESIFSLGNGRFGQRGYFEEPYSSDSYRGSFVAGITFLDKTRVGWWKNGFPPYYTRIPKAADWSRINLRLIDEELDLAGWDVDSFNRRLDMKEGISYRDMEVTSPRGNQLRIHVEHITNMARPNLCLIKYSVSSINYTGRISLVPILDAALRQKKKRVLAIDMDGQANLTESCGLSIEEEQTVYGAMRGEYPLPVIELENGLAVVPSCLDLSAAESELINEPGRELILKGLIAKLLDSRKFDYILIDCPPSLGLLTLNALTTADLLIIPVQAQFLAMRGMAKITSVIEIVKERLNPNLSIGGIVITQFDKRKTLNKSVAEIINDSFCDKVFKTIVRDNVALAEAPIKGKNVFEYNKNCNGAKDYMALAQEVLKLK